MTYLQTFTRQLGGARHTFARRVRSVRHLYRPPTMYVHWVKAEGMLPTLLGERFAPPGLPAAQAARIALAVARTQRLGQVQLWPEYGEGIDATRDPDGVGTVASLGAFYVWLVKQLRPDVIVEFGTGFGYSGMYFLTGLERAGSGRLYTFEPNGAWRKPARGNLASISRRYVSIEGRFEDNLTVLRNQPIDLAFIDAIHTSDFVRPQFEIVAARLRSGGIILLDDIDFSDDMRACWRTLVSDSRVSGAAELDAHVGLLEFC